MACASLKTKSARRKSSVIEGVKSRDSDLQAGGTGKRKSPAKAPLPNASPGIKTASSCILNSAAILDAIRSRGILFEFHEESRKAR